MKNFLIFYLVLCDGSKKTIKTTALTIPITNVPNRHMNILIHRHLE